MKIVNILVLLTLVVLFGCEAPGEFKGFKWDVELSVPLMNRSYPIFDLEDHENFVIEDSLLILFYNNEMESDDASEILKLRSKSSRLMQIPPIDMGVNVSIPIDESGIDEDIRVTHAVISEGKIIIEVTQVREELQEMTVEFKDFKSPDDEPFVLVIDDFGESLFYGDISGFYIGEENSKTVIDSLNFFVSVVNEPTNETLATVRIFFDSLYFDYFEGYFTNKRIEIDEQMFESNVSYPFNISNAITLQEALLNLTFMNELGFDARFVGSITAINYKDNRNSTLHLTVEDEVVIHRAQSVNNGKLTNTAIDKPELTDFLNVYPEKLILNNAAIVIGNVDNSIGFASASNKNYGSFKLSTPSIIAVSNTTIVPDTVYSVEISEENRRYIERYPERINLTFTMENSTPLGAIVDIFFSNSPDTLHLFGYQSPDTLDIRTVLFPGNYVGAHLDEQNPGVYEVDFYMDREDIELFLNEKVYFALKITFDSSDGPVFIRPSQYLNILGRLDIEIKIDI